jgi:tRNA (uracil-5-)-methyltransferase TRM9
MKTDVIQRLNQLNKEFYLQIADSFAATRQNPWQGWYEFVPYLTRRWVEKTEITVLDIGCGTGRFGEFLAQQFPTIHFQYTGIDSNETLLEIARIKLNQQNLQFELKIKDLIEVIQLNEVGKLSKEKFDLVVAFGVIHHIPSFGLRNNFLKMIKNMLQPNGAAIIASWQFVNDQNLMDRKLNPEEFKISPDELEEDDYLLPWQNEKNIARFCHYIDQHENTQLLTETELKVSHSFYADGKEGNLNLYQLLEKYLL